MSLVTMYRKEELTPISTENFFFPLEGKLSEDNRWVIMTVPNRQFP
jgi:transposase, IS5 family